jgi:hypothetical protein
VFEGHDEALGILETALVARGGAVVTQAVYGLGGVGKSELALQCAGAHRDDYNLVWWITAANAGEVETRLAGLAGRLCPVVEMTGTNREAAGWATGWLRPHDRWLLILDSRRDADWGRLADPVRLDVLAPAAAAQVLTVRTGRHEAGDEQAAVQIVAELGFFPLAMDQAAAYIVRQQKSPAAYLDSLRRNPARMHDAGTGAKQTIARLWDLHITASHDQNPVATWLLGVIAQYAPDAIPRAMLGGAPHESTDEAPVTPACLSDLAAIYRDLRQPGEAPPPQWRAGQVRQRQSEQTARDWAGNLPDRRLPAR